MEAIGEDPDIRLAEGEGRGLRAGKRVEIYSRKSNELLAQESQQEVEYKKELQRNLEKVNKIQEDTRINVIQKEISEKIS